MRTCWLVSLVLAAVVGAARAEQFLSESMPTPPLFTPIGEIQNFTLTDQDGKPFQPERLRGKVWVAHFFYSGCKECNQRTIGPMTELQNAIRGKHDLALVSISLNPEADSSETLASFARDHQAEPGQWTFATGKSFDEVKGIVQGNFKQTVEKNAGKPPEEAIAHSFWLFVVDRDGKIAGYFNAKEETNVAPLLERLRGLASERYVLPAVNAMLNALAGFLLVVGYVAIRRKRVGLHKAIMLTALACSGIFLCCYLYYHFAVLRGQSPRLVGPGAVRIVYLTILLTHTVLAVVVAPLAIWVSYLGLNDRLAKHVKVARWTLPIWLYVSVTGVVVYVMLYHLYPPYLRSGRMPSRKGRK